MSSTDSAMRGEQTFTTRSGVRILVRRVTGADEPALSDFFAHVTAADLRFRFLTSVNEVDHARLVEMIEVGPNTESYLATVEDAPDTVVAAAILALDTAGERAEVAITIRADRKGQGIGWTLLDHLANRAADRGARVIESVESRANRAAIALEREMGFTAESVEGDPGVVLLRRTLTAQEPAE